MTLLRLYIQSLALWIIVSAVLLGTGITLAFSGVLPLPEGIIIPFILNYMGITLGVQQVTKAGINLYYLLKGKNAKLDTQQFEG